MKYEAPALGKIGKAETVILGQVLTGADIDGYYWQPELEFLNDRETEIATAVKTA